MTRAAPDIIGSTVWFAAPAAMVPDTVRHGIGQIGKWLSLGVHFGGVDVTVGSVLGALLLFAAFLVVARVVKGLLHGYVERHEHINRSSVYTVERLLHYLLMVVGALWALSIAGIPMAKMTVFAGALGVGLGFGLQAIFNNFVSGLILLFERSLKVGDFVELSSGLHGHVRDINIRATRVSTNDNIDILVPNSEFVNGRVVNWTLREVSRRIKVPFGVAYGTDKELVKKAALEAAAEVPFTLSMEGPRAPQVWLVGFGDSSLDFQLVVWLDADATRHPGSVTAAYNWALHTALEKYEIEVPFPQRDLHVRSWATPVTGPRPGPVGGGAGENDAVRDVVRDIAETRADQAGDSSARDSGAPPAAS
ncbi:mechanosensitive ion channel family protein [Dyella sp. A6]|uniref:mechanosensitive ion channel family protein n=1 Tax=Dyella aluminiiresistens TaxID=3069105 RepID=UPI002E792F89|nr:mechanosensitive ion channel domain-containing protein [Dyella sp. A6]